MILRWRVPLNTADRETDFTGVICDSHN